MDNAWHLVEEHLPLEIRSPRGGGGGGGGGAGGGGSGGGGGGGGGHGGGSSKGGSSNSGSSSSGGSSSKGGSSSSSGTTVIVVGGSGHGGGGYIGNLPTWAVVLIIFFGIILTVFICALLFHLLKERKRKREGHKFRLGHALWNAVKIALLIWVAIKIWKCCCARRRHKDGAKSALYSKIVEGQAQNSDAWYGASTAPAATSYGAGGTGYAAADTKYEPMGYTGAAGVGATITPDPLPSPTPAITSHGPVSPEKSPATLEALSSPAVSSPPPYSSSSNRTSYPTTAATSSGGASESYHMAMAMSHAYVPSMPSTYEPSIMSSGSSTPLPSGQVAYPPPATPSPAPPYAAKPTYVPSGAPGPRYAGS